MSCHEGKDEKQGIIIVDRLGTIYVVEGVNYRIQKFTILS